MHLRFYRFWMRILARLAGPAGALNGKLARRNRGLKNQRVPSLRKTIWIHAASLGEFEQGKMVIDGLRQRYPDRTIVLTFFSPSGYEKRKDYPAADHVFYLPYDTPGAMKEFVEKLDPSLVVIIKYEFWFTLLGILRDRRIPYVFVSAVFREDQYFFKKGFAPFRALLQSASRIFVQNEASRQLLRKWDFKNVVLTGDTRLDRTIEIRKEAFSMEILEEWKAGRFCFIAGSTWPPDEKLLASVFRKYSNWKWIIAPHEVHRGHIEQLSSMFGEKAVTLSRAEAERSAGKTDLLARPVLIIDRIGILSRLYRYGDLAYIGGGFGAGIHNTLEPAAYGLPLVFGPEYEKFQEALDFQEAGAAKVIGRKGDRNVAKLSEDLVKILATMSEPEKRESVRQELNRYFMKHAGSTALILRDIKHILR